MVILEVSYVLLRPKTQVTQVRRRVPPPISFEADVASSPPSAKTLSLDTGSGNKGRLDGAARGHRSKNRRNRRRRSTPNSTRCGDYCHSLKVWCFSMRMHGTPRFDPEIHLISCFKCLNLIKPKSLRTLSQIPCRSNTQSRLSRSESVDLTSSQALSENTLPRSVLSSKSEGRVDVQVAFKSMVDWTADKESRPKVTSALFMCSVHIFTLTIQHD